MQRWILVAILATGCDDKDTEDSGASSSVSYADVEPILATHCVGCHVEGGSAPFALDSYEAASSRSDRLVVRAVDGEGGTMPPSGLVLSDEEAGILIDWDAAGAPEATR